MDASRPAPAPEDSLLTAVAHEDRRRALRELNDAESAVSLTALASALTETPARMERVAITLHHQHLPLLDDMGVVEYDTEQQTAERGHAFDTCGQLLTTVTAADTDEPTTVAESG